MSQSVFGRPLVTNVFRALLVEAMVAEVLGPGWRWCSADYSNWDFEHDDGTRLEVKQSANRQSWAQEGAPPSRCSFDIAMRTGRYEGTLWVSEHGRSAQVFVFAHHPVSGSEADHRDPQQWLFYVVPTTALPDTSTIGLAGVAKRARPVTIDCLADAVAGTRSSLNQGDAVKTVREEEYADGRIRLLQTASGYAGNVVIDGKAQATIQGRDPEEVWAKLQQELQRSSAAYFGYDGAIDRFLAIFPGGFKDPTYVAMERDYKIAAAERLARELPLESSSLGAESCVTAARVFGRTNLLSQFEQARIRDVLKGPQGLPFLQGATAFARGQLASGLAAMLAAVRPHGQPSWPMITYLPFLWRPNEHMFLKPKVTLEFAERVGDPLGRIYGSGYEAPVYEALQAMTSKARQELARLQPEDGIDLQSFIWVIGGYTERDLSDVKRRREQA